MIMNLNEFVKKFAAEFEETPVEVFNPSTEYRSLDEWGSLTALSIISMIDEEFDILLTGADLRSVSTIEALYELIQSKK